MSDPKYKYCIVCEEWKHKAEMIAIDVCEKCFETHDKYGKRKETTKQSKGEIT